MRKIMRNTTERLILYDELPSEKIKKYEFWFRIKVFIFGSFLTAILIFIMYVTIIEGWINPVDSIDIILGIMFSLMLILGIISSFIFVLSKDVLKIYSDGLVLPEKRIKQYVFREENFIPFTDIDAIYLNRTLPYVTIIGKNIFPPMLLKDKIYNMNHFIKVLKEKNILNVETKKI